MRKIDALFLAITTAIVPIASQAADACTVIIGPRPDEASRLVTTCRSKMEPPNDYYRGYYSGYCQGYIDSKLERLSKEKWAMITARMRARPDQVGFSPSADIMKIIQSSGFEHHFYVFKSGAPRPLSADTLLDHIIDDLLYTEQPLPTQARP